MLEKIKTKNLTFAGLWVLFTAALALWAEFLCREDSLSHDTFYQLNLIKHPWNELLYYISIDYSPPLYAFVLKIYASVFGYGLAGLRVFSTVILAAGLLIIFFPFRRLMGKTSSVVAACMYISSAYLFYFSVEVRPAVLAYVLTTGMFVYAVLALFEGRKSDMIMFTVLACLCMYTHNVSLIAAFCVYGTTIILALIRKRFDVFKKFLISGIAVAVLYIPWLIVLMGQYSNVMENYWSNEGSLPFAFFIVLIGIVENELIPYLSFITIIFIIFLPLLLLILMIPVKRYKTAGSVRELITVKEIKQNCPNINKFLYLALITAVSIIGFYLFTVLLVPVFVERYLYILSGGGILLLASLVSLYDRKKVLAVILSVMVLVTGVCNAYKKRGDLDSYTRDQMIEDVTRISGDEPVFIHPTEYTISYSKYALPNSHHFATTFIGRVLVSLDVLNTDITYLPDYDSLWDYTDEAYIIDFEKIGQKSDEEAVEYALYWFSIDDELEVEVVGRYTFPYVCDFDECEGIVLRVTRK